MYIMGERGAEVGGGGGDLQENFLILYSTLQKKKQNTSLLNPSPFLHGIHKYPLEPPQKMLWILMHGMATLRKLVSFATCSLFLKDKIKIQGIDCLRDINLSWKVF